MNSKIDISAVQGIAMPKSVYDPTTQNVDAFQKKNLLGKPSYQDGFRVRVTERDLEFPGLAAAKTAYGAATFYPGDYCVDEVRGLLFCNYAPNVDPNSRGQLIVVRTFPGYAYVSWFSVGLSASPCAIDRDSDPTKCYLVKRNGSRNIGKWDITTLPTDGALITPAITGSTADDAYVYMGGRHGFLYVNQFTEAYGGLSTLTEYAEFDKNLARTGKRYSFSVDQVGSLTEPAKSENPHMQGFQKGDGFFFCTYGGNYNDGSGAPTVYQLFGVKLLSDEAKPATLLSAMCFPSKVIPLFRAAGLTVNRVEMEGGFVLADGRCFAFAVTNWDPGTPGASKVAMIEFFASGKDTIDLSSASVSVNHPMIQQPAAMWPRDGGVYRNPQTGSAWAGINEICDFLAGPYAQANGITEWQGYRNFLPTGFTDVAGVVFDNVNTIFPNAAHITIRSENSTTFHQIVESASEGREMWIVNGSPRVQNLVDHKFSASKGGTNQTGVVTATFTKVTFTTETWDRGGYYDAANSRWTPPAGRVSMDACVEFSGAGNIVAAQIYAVAIYKNGAQVKISEVHSSNTGNLGAAVHHEDVASGTDYYEVYAYGGGAGDKIIQGSAIRSAFSGKKI